jgi:hypothetical protein
VVVVGSVVVDVVDVDVLDVLVDVDDVVVVGASVVGGGSVVVGAVVGGDVVLGAVVGVVVAGVVVVVVGLGGRVVDVVGAVVDVVDVDDEGVGVVEATGVTPGRRGAEVEDEGDVVEDEPPEGPCGFRPGRRGDDGWNGSHEVAVVGPAGRPADAAWSAGPPGRVAGWAAASSPQPAAGPRGGGPPVTNPWTGET